MRTRKLVTLGSLVLALGVGSTARAEEAAVPAADAEATDVAEEPAEVPEAPAVEPEPDEAQASSPEAPAQAPDAGAVEEQAAGAGPEGAMEAAAEPPPAPMELGAVGYDAQGRPGRIHVVRSGDTLWDVSNAYLGTPWVWPSIWKDNQEIANPHLIHPGDRIWITPSEMRRVSAEEADALLAGSPAAPETAQALEPPAPAAAPAQMVPAERPVFTLSDGEWVGLVTEETLEAAGSMLSNVRPHILISESDRVWVSLGADRAHVGDQLSIFRVQERIYDPDTNRSLGHHVRMLGWGEIVEVSDEASLLVVRQSNTDMAVGDRLMPREEPLREIALQPSVEEVEGRISFLAGSRTSMGTMDYVFLNRGTLDGLDVGMPVQVFREGFPRRDDLTHERVHVPDRVVADLLVVKAQPEAAVALVRHTEEEIALGDHFRTPD